MDSIEQIAEKRLMAKQWLDIVGIRNTVGLSTLERIELDIEYAKAQADYERWNDQYRGWINNKATTP
jgi:hypothetical protein